MSVHPFTLPPSAGAESLFIRELTSLYCAAEPMILGNACVHNPGQLRLAVGLITAAKAAIDAALLARDQDAEGEGGEAVPLSLRLSE